MLININRAKEILLIGDDLELDENKEYYILVKTSPTAREEKDGEVIMKVAVDNGLAYRLNQDEAKQLIATRND